MLRSNSPVSRPMPFGLDQMPDYTQLREHAHHERSKAISLAFTRLWSRIRGAGSLSEQDTRFWQA